MAELFYSLTGRDNPHPRFAADIPLPQNISTPKRASPAPIPHSLFTPPGQSFSHRLVTPRKPEFYRSPSLVVTSTPRDRFIAERSDIEPRSLSRFLSFSEEDHDITAALQLRQTPRGHSSLHRSGIITPLGSPSPSRNLFGSAARSTSRQTEASLGSQECRPRVCLHGDSDTSRLDGDFDRSLSRTVNSLLGTPNRFESEVGTDATLEDDENEANGGAWQERQSKFMTPGGAINPSSPPLTNFKPTPKQQHVLVNVDPYQARLAQTLFNNVVPTVFSGPPNEYEEEGDDNDLFSPDFCHENVDSTYWDRGTSALSANIKHSEKDLQNEENETVSPLSRLGEVPWPYGGTIEEGNEADSFRRNPVVIFEENRKRNFSSPSFRPIPTSAERILDARNIVNDFYYNVMDFSRTNKLGIALQSIVYVWDWKTEEIESLPSQETCVSALKWAPDGSRMAISNENGDIIVENLVEKMREALFCKHTDRVCCLAWNSTGRVLASGGRDNAMIFHDTRSKTSPITIHQAHQQEICALQWSQQDHFLASGGDDNQVRVWDCRHLQEPLHTFSDHQSAVKALSWNPIYPSLLMSGGGKDDKTLRFWDVTTGECLRHINTGSQVSGALWHSSGTELVTGHGAPKFEVAVWRYPALTKIAEFHAHRSSVLHLCLSADSSTVVSAASDETIRFWLCFDKLRTPV